MIFLLTVLKVTWSDYGHIKIQNWNHDSVLSCTDNVLHENLSSFNVKLDDCPSDERIQISQESCKLIQNL